MPNPAREPTLNVLRLVRASAAVPGLPLLRGSSDVVRARITETAIARQNIASAVAVFERVILAVPIVTTCACLDHCAPWGLVSPSWQWTKDQRCKTNDCRENHSGHVRSPCLLTKNNTEKSGGIPDRASKREFVMPASPPIADMCSAPANVGYGPIADVSCNHLG